MDTLTIPTSQNKNDFRFRAAAIFAGVLIAIICALVSLKTNASTSSNEAAERAVETPVFVKLSHFANAASMVGHSVMTLSNE